MKQVGCGPTPAELFVASLAACAAQHARRLLRDRGLPADGMEITACFVMGAGPRLARISLDVRPPLGPSELHRDALLAVIDRCILQNSLLDLPRISVDVAAAEPQAV